MTNKDIYIERLTNNMRSAGQENWAHNDMADMCELAGLWVKWLGTSTRKQEESLTLKAAKILGVEIRHYIPV